MSFASRLTRSPNAFDPEHGAEAVALFGDHPAEIRSLIAGTAGCSPYLRGLILRHADWLRACLDQSPEDSFADVMKAVQALNSSDLRAGLRLAKSRVALLIALADLGGVWSLEQVTDALTQFADLATDRALRAMVGAEIARGKLPATDGDDTGGLVAIAMGKMGAFELNYSSDIDLIMLFDGERYDVDSYDEARPALVRATRRMASLLSEITGEGYVFRTDLRLRPDASVTPVCLSMDAAEAYYESVGRTWERAAYIKARAAAGDVAAGARFLQRLTPFVWRKHLDFAAIQDAHDMRLRIRAHKRLHRTPRLEGHNMKLGAGGIREIEFFTQTRQIIAGGRDPRLRVRGTVDGLARLVETDWVARDLAQTLTNAYRAHREVEHRIQMIGDAQTHDLPSDPAGFARLAAFMGQSEATLRQELTDRLAQVHGLTEGFFAPHTPDTDVETPSEAQAVMDRWLSYPALRTERAVEIFERVRPEVMARLNKAAKPLEALEQFDGFLAGLPAGVQVFSMFEANPQLIDLLVDIAATSPALSRYLGRNAQVFDAVIAGTFFAPWPGEAALRAELAGQISLLDDYEVQLDTARRWHKEWHFRIGVHHLRGLIDAGEAGQHYADLAEAVLGALWDPVVDEFARKHGRPPGRGAVVLGMGSLGGAQLSAASDLDLIVIYDADGVEASDGRRPLSAGLYYARLTQAFVTAMSAQTAEGALYEVDMRLRPSGRQGPVATSLGAFRDYQRNEAWTWEHLALTRARAVAGSKDLAHEVEAFRAELLATPRDPAKICADVADMRARLAKAGGGDADWEVKRGPGAMQDIDLLAQTAALLTQTPKRRTSDQLAAAQQAGWLSSDQHSGLVETYGLLWTAQAAIRLLAGTDFKMEDLGEGGRGILLRQTGAVSIEALSQDIAARLKAADTLVDACLKRFDFT